MFHHPGLDAGRGHVIHHVHVGNEAQDRAAVAGDIAGDGAVQVPVSVQPDVFQAQGPHLLFQHAGKHPLLFGAGTGLGIAVGGGVIGNIVQQSFIGTHEGDLL